MINFEIDDQDRLILESVEHFAKDQLEPRIRTAEKARKVEKSVIENFEALELGWLEIPESLGGSSCGLLTRVLVNEALAMGDPGATLALDRVGAAYYPIWELGGEAAVKEHLLPLLENPEKRALLVHTNDAQLQQNNNHISGTIPWVPADQIDLLILLDNQGVSVLEVGWERQEIRGSGLRAAGASELSLTQAPIKNRWEDSHKAKHALAKARLYYGALLLGVLEKGATYSRTYAQNRTTFGKPIAHHQALTFLITDMNTAVHSARLLLQEAACRCDSGSGFVEEAATAFVEAIEVSNFVGPACVQILGGHGFMQDFPVEKYMRESRALGLMLGGSDVARGEALQILTQKESPISLLEGVL